MTVAVVTTTIHAESRLDKWAEQLGKDDFLIIAEDHKTPREALHSWVDDLAELHGFTPVYTYEESLPYATSEIIGWNTIQRRNIALLKALELTPDVIITVDDDNYPAGDQHVAQVRNLLVSDEVRLPVYNSKSGWYNVGQMLDPPVVHRGYPLSQRHESTLTQITRRAVPLGVHASLWLGDPDVDAIERICCDPSTTVSPDWPASELIFALDTDTWCPFNTQATAYYGDTAQLFILPPGLGRYDDIWGSYITRRLFDHMNYFVSYGAPLVYQDRNPHNLVKDLHAELYGLEHTDRFVELLRGIELTAYASDHLDCLQDICTQLVNMSEAPLPAQAREYLRRWPADVRRAVAGG